MSDTPSPGDDCSSPASRLLLAFVAYFGLGAYYNYSTYGASGMDLIPYVTTPASSKQPADFLAAIATFGEKSRICCATSHPTYALLFGRDKQVAVATLLYDS